MRAVRSVVFFIVVLGAAGIMMFYRLGDASIQNWDEGVYAKIVNESFADGLKIIPTLMGAPWVEKPPLGLWFIRLGTQAFGFNQFGIRALGSAAMVGSFIVIYFLIKRLYGDTVSLVATMLIIFSPLWYYVHMSRSGDLEAFFLLFSWLAVYLYIISWEKPQRLLWVGCALGLAFLVRGHIALLPLMAITAHVIITKKWKIIPARQFFLALGLFGLVITPWHACVLWREPALFWESYIQTHVLGRVTTPIQNHAGGWLYYWNFLRDRLSFGWYAMMTLWIVGAYHWIQTRDQRTTLWWLLLAFFLLPLHVMQTKLFWYLHPLVPALYLACIPGILSFIQIAKNEKNKKTLALASIASAGMYGIFTLGSGWHHTITPTITRPTLVAYEIEANGWQTKPIGVFGVETWYGGQLLPGTFVEWQMFHRYTILTLDERVAPIYAQDPAYEIFVMDKERAAFFTALSPEAHWQKIALGDGVSVLMVKRGPDAFTTQTANQKNSPQ